MPNLGMDHRLRQEEEVIGNYMNPDSNVHDLKDVNVGDWDWDRGTFPESGIIIEDAHMVEGVGGTEGDAIEMDDSDSDGNYEHFSDSDYGLSEEENADVNIECVQSKNATNLLPTNLVEGNEIMYEEEEEGDEEDSDDGFGSMDEEEEEQGHDQTLNKKKVFRPLKGREEPVFCNGMVFKRRYQLAEAIRQHAILQGKDIKFIKNETTRGEASEVVKVISEIIGLPHEEVQEHLQRIQGSIYHLELLVRMQESTVPYDKQEGIHGESTSLFTGIDDADVEDEYNKIEMEVGSGTSQLCSSEVVVTSAKAKTEDHKTSESLSDALSNLSLVDSTPMEPVTLDSMKRTRKSFNDLQLESTWLRLLSFLTIRF